VQNYQKNGITGNEVGTSLTATGNSIIGQGPTTGAAENSIQIGFGATGTIKNNIVGDDVWSPDVFGDTGNAAAGILVYASSGVTTSGNLVNNTQFGIAYVSDPTLGTADGGTIVSNKISATHLYDGIDVCSNSNTRILSLTGTDVCSPAVAAPTTRAKAKSRLSASRP
jgi:nitrous oxidase accessory protein NosD